MTTRRELTEAVGEWYRRSDRNEKRQILDEFIQLTGYYRKHAIRALCREKQPSRTKPGPQRRYDGELRAALITLREAADRIRLDDTARSPVAIKWNCANGSTR